MSTPSPISATATIAEQVRAKPVATTARVTAAVLLVAVPFMIGAICWRWATVHEPTTAVVIGGDASIEGTTIVVSSARNDASGPEPNKTRRYSGPQWTVSLDRNNGWQTPVLLDPGEYHITATHHGRSILNESFQLERLKGIRFDLPSMVHVIGGNSLADSKIEIVRESGNAGNFEPIELKLSSLGHYRASIYLFPGTYRAIARNPAVPDRILAQVEFTVDRTTTVHVDLAKAASEGE